MWVECKFPQEAMLSDIPGIKVQVSYCMETCTVEHCPIKRELALKHIKDAAPEFTRIQQILEKSGTCPLKHKASRWCTANLRYCEHTAHCQVFKDSKHKEPNTETIKKRRIKMQYLVKTGHEVELVNESMVGTPDQKGSVEYELVLEAEYVPVEKWDGKEGSSVSETPKISDPVLKKGLKSLLVVTGSTFTRVTSLEEVTSMLKEGNHLYIVKKLWEKKEVLKRKKVVVQKTATARKPRTRKS